MSVFCWVAPPSPGSQEEPPTPGTWGRLRNKPRPGSGEATAAAGPSRASSPLPLRVWREGGGHNHQRTEALNPLNKIKIRVQAEGSMTGDKHGLISVINAVYGYRLWLSSLVSCSAIFYLMFIFIFKLAVSYRLIYIKKNT